jgi:hypothetical protein
MSDENKRIVRRYFEELDRRRATPHPRRVPVGKRAADPSLVSSRIATLRSARA